MSNLPQAVIEATWGPMVSGMMLQQLLLGILCVQVFDYYHTFPKDTAFHKWLVGLMFTLNVFIGATNFHALYRSAVTHYGDFEGFDIQTWTGWIEPAFTAAIGFLAQIFFLERVYRATRSCPVMVILTTMVLISFGFGIAETVGFTNVQRLSMLEFVPIPVTGWLISTAITDISISAVLIVALIRSKTPFRRTEQVVFHIARQSMETSLTTAIVAALNLILYYMLPKTAYYLIPQLCICRLYASTVMVTLSARTEIRNILFGDGYSSYVTREAAAPQQIHNIKVTTTVVHEAVRPSQESADIESAQSGWMGHHNDLKTSFGEPKAEEL